MGAGRASVARGGFGATWPAEDNSLRRNEDGVAGAVVDDGGVGEDVAVDAQARRVRRHRELRELARLQRARERGELLAGGVEERERRDDRVVAGIRDAEVRAEVRGELELDQIAAVRR